MMDFAKINEIVAELAMLPYYPKDEIAHSAIVRLVGQMAGKPITLKTGQVISEVEQVRWLVNRMTSGLYSEWPGPGELRACFCSKFRPADGIERHSSVYVDGIPSEKRPMMGFELDYARQKQLEAGPAVSAAPSLQRAVQALAAAKDINNIGKPTPHVPGIPVRQLASGEEIAAADVERELEKRREERGRQELGLVGAQEATDAKA